MRNTKKSKLKQVFQIVLLNNICWDNEIMRRIRRYNGALIFKKTAHNYALYDRPRITEDTRCQVVCMVYDVAETRILIGRN